jgi:hypothetical protein
MPFSDWVEYMVVYVCVREKDRETLYEFTWSWFVKWNEMLVRQVSGLSTDEIIDWAKEV